MADVEDTCGGTVLAPPKKLKGLACITGTALEDLISPANLNGGALEDIYKVHQEDFDDPQTLEVAYSDGRGGVVREIVFVDPVHSEKQPRIFASIAGIQAMHNAISVLSRKVDSLVSTLQQSRAAYFKELLALRSQLGLQRHAMEEDAEAEFCAADVTFFHDLDRQRRIEEITHAIDQKVHRATMEIEEQLGWTREEVKRLQTKLTIAEREKLRAAHEGVFYEDHKLVLEELLKNKDAKELLRCFKDLSIEDQNEDRFFGSMMDLVGEHKGLDLRNIEREMSKERERRQSMEQQLAKADTERRALSTEKKQLRYELEELKLEQLRRGSGETHKSILEELQRTVGLPVLLQSLEELKLEQLRRGSGETHKSILEELQRTVGLPVLLQSLEEVVPQASNEAFYAALEEMLRRYRAVDAKEIKEDLSYRQLLARLAEGGATPKELILALKDMIDFPHASGFLHTLVELLEQLTGVEQGDLLRGAGGTGEAEPHKEEKATSEQAMTGHDKTHRLEGASNPGSPTHISRSRSEALAGSRGQKQATPGHDKMQLLEGTGNAGHLAPPIGRSRSEALPRSRGQRQAVALRKALEQTALQKGQSRELLLALRDVAAFSSPDELLQALKEVIEELTGADLRQEEEEPLAPADDDVGGGGDVPLLETVTSAATGEEQEVQTTDGLAGAEPEGEPEGAAEGAEASRNGTESHEAPEVPVPEPPTEGGRSDVSESDSDSDVSTEDLQEEPSFLHRQALEDLLEKGARPEELLLILKDLARQAGGDGFVDALVAVLGQLTGVDVRDLERDLSEERASRRNAEERYVVLKRQSVQAAQLHPPRVKSLSQGIEDPDHAEGPSTAPAPLQEGDAEEAAARAEASGPPQAPGLSAAAEASEPAGSGFGRRRLVQSTSHSRRGSQEDSAAAAAAAERAELLERGVQAQELLRELKARGTLTEAQGLLRELKARGTLTEADDQLVSSLTHAVGELVQAVDAHHVPRAEGQPCSAEGGAGAGGSGGAGPWPLQGANRGSVPDPSSPESCGGSDRRGSAGQRVSTGSRGALEEEEVPAAAAAGPSRGGGAAIGGGEAAAAGAGEEPVRLQKRLQHMESTALPGFMQATPPPELLAELTARAGQAKDVLWELKDSGLLLNTLIEILEDLTGVDRHSLQQEQAGHEENRGATLQTELGTADVAKHLETALVEAAPRDQQPVGPEAHEDLRQPSATAVEPAAIELRVSLQEASDEVQRRRQDLGQLLALLRHLVDPAAAEGAAKRLLSAAASGWQPGVDREVTAPPGEVAADEQASGAVPASVANTLHPDLLHDPSALTARAPLAPAAEEVCLDDIELQVDEPAHIQGPVAGGLGPAAGGVPEEVRGRGAGLELRGAEATRSPAAQATGAAAAAGNQPQLQVTSPRSKGHGSDSDRSLSASARRTDGPLGVGREGQAAPGQTGPGQDPRALPRDRQRPVAPVQELTLIVPGIGQEGGGGGGGLRRPEPTSPPSGKSRALVAQQHDLLGEGIGRQRPEDTASTTAARRSTVSQITLDASNLLLPVPPCSPGRTGFAWQGVISGHAHKRATMEGSPGDGLPQWNPSKEAQQGGGSQLSPKHPTHLSTITLEVPGSEFGGTAEPGGAEHQARPAQSRGPAKPAAEGGKATRRRASAEDELAIQATEGGKSRRTAASEHDEDAGVCHPEAPPPAAAAAPAEPLGSSATSARGLLDLAEFRPLLPSRPVPEQVSPRQPARTLHPATSRKAEDVSLPTLAIGPPQLKPPGSGGSAQGDAAELSRSPRLLLQPLQHDGGKGPQWAVRRGSYGVQQEQQEKEQQEKGKAPPGPGQVPQVPTLLPQVSPPTAAQHLRMEFGGGRSQIGISSAQDALLERGRQLLQRGPRRRRFGVERSEPALETLARVQQDLEMSHGSLSQAWVNMHSGASKDVLPCSLLVKGLLAAGVAQSDANSFIQLLLASAATNAAAGSKGNVGGPFTGSSPGADFRSPRTTTTVSVVDFFAAFSPDGLPQRAVDAARVASCRVGLWEGRPSPPPISKSRTPRGAGAAE